MSVYEGEIPEVTKKSSSFFTLGFSYRIVYCKIVNSSRSGIFLRPLASRLVFRLVVVCSFVPGGLFLILALLLFSVVNPIACFCC